VVLPGKTHIRRRGSLLNSTPNRVIHPLLEAPNLSIAGSACEAFLGHLGDETWAFLPVRTSGARVRAVAKPVGDDPMSWTVSRGNAACCAAVTSSSRMS
jgi:hypothetical protein